MQVAPSEAEAGGSTALSRTVSLQPVNRKVGCHQTRMVFDGNGQCGAAHEAAIPVVLSNRQEPAMTELCSGDLMGPTSNRIELLDHGNGMITVSFKTGAGNQRLAPHTGSCLRTKQRTQSLLRKWRNDVFMMFFLAYWRDCATISKMKKSKYITCEDDAFATWVRKCSELDNVYQRLKNFNINAPDEDWISVCHEFLEQPMLGYALLDGMASVYTIPDEEYNAWVKLVQSITYTVRCCNKFCMENNMDPKSEWVMKALTRIVKSRVRSRWGMVTNEDVAPGRELAFLRDCLYTGLGPGAPMTSIRKLKDKLNNKLAREAAGAAPLLDNKAAQAAADAAAAALLDEVEKEKTETRNKQLKKKAAKAAKKKRRSLAPIDETALLDVAPSVQTTASVADTGSESKEFVHLSDLAASLTDKDDDAATSVATALQCVVCLSGERSTACVPCGHMCLCDKCATNDKMRNCPMCRAEIQTLVRVWQ